MHSTIIKNKWSPDFASIGFWFIVAAILSLGLILLTNDVFAVAAAPAAAADPIGDRLCAILQILMGPTAKAIATVAVIFVAIGLFAGRMTWLTVIPIIIGVIVIFSAPALVVFFAGAGDAVCTNP